MTALPFRATTDGLQVSVRLTPRGSADRIRGIEPGPGGTPEIRAMVTAPPESGKANAALLKLLAKAWKLPKTSLSVISGATARRKVVHIAGDPATLLTRLKDWGRTNT